MTPSSGRLGWAQIAAGVPQGAQVLVVDDDPGIRRAIGAAVEAMGHEVRRASSAEEADHWLSSQAFDLVLLDVDLPRMNGLELLTWALRRRKDLAILMLTGHAEPDLALRCLAAGARGYLVKPIDLAFLERAVRDALAVRALLQERNALAVGRS